MMNPTRVTWDDYNSDLNFVIGQDGVTGSSLHKDGFEYLWAGARASHGVSRGKVCYEVSIQEKLEVKMPESETSPHVLRVGWSTDSSNFTVGEGPLSYGYGGTGKSSCNNKFFNYGERFSTNDVIACYIDLDAVPKAIFFTKNGNYLGVAFHMGPEANGQVFYPHVTGKNMKFVANFGDVQPYFPPVQGFCLLQFLPSHMLVLPPAFPKERQDCEVLMMVGLPSCGKTTWLEKFVKDYPEKKYNVLGTNSILCKMKVMGLSRKRNYHGRWDALIKQASGILNEMLKVAQRKNRNYILDQTNVYPNARRRKMNNFRGYRHIAAVIVNNNTVLKERNAKVIKKDGKVVPESAFMEMKANFTLPVEGDVFDEVWYVEENKERSQQLVEEFNHEGRMWKEEQKKRPADTQPKSEEPTSSVKKFKQEPVATCNLPSSGFQYGSGHYPNRSRDYVDSPAGVVGNTEGMRTAHSYREAGDVRSSTGNDSHQRNFFQGNGGDSNSRQASYAPPHSSYHQASSGNTYHHHHAPAARDEQALSYYPENWQQQYGQRYPNQPQYSQMYNNSSQYGGNVGRGTNDWDTAQRPSNDQYQNYYASIQETVPPRVKQENWTQQQSYGYQEQHGNYNQRYQ